MNLLYAIGYGILHILWQTAVVYVIFVLLCKILAPSHRKIYVLALFSQLIIFLLFIFNIICFAGKDLSISYDAAPFSAERFLPCLSGLYFVFLIYSIIAAGKQFNNLKNIKYYQKQADYHIINFVREKILTLNINRKVKLAFTNFNHSPFVKGFLKPVIYLPVSISTYLSPQQIEAIVLHELIHIKRHDYLINLIQIIIEKILYFNPLLKIIGNIARQEREIVCDEEVSKNYEHIVYSEALFSIAKYNNVSAVSVYAAGNSKTELLDRIRQLNGLQTAKTKLNYKVLLTTTALSIFALALTGNRQLLQPKKALATIVKELPENIDNQSIKRIKNIYTIAPVEEKTKEKAAPQKGKTAASKKTEKTKTKRNIEKIPEIEEKIPEIYTITAKNNSPQLQKAFRNLNLLLQNEQLQFRTHNISNIETPEGSLFNAENHFQTENYAITVLESDFETKIIVEKTEYSAQEKILN